LGVKLLSQYCSVGDHVFCNAVIYCNCECHDVFHDIEILKPQDKMSCGQEGNEMAENICNDCKEGRHKMCNGLAYPMFRNSVLCECRHEQRESLIPRAEILPKPPETVEDVLIDVRTLVGMERKEGEGQIIAGDMERWVNIYQRAMKEIAIFYQTGGGNHTGHNELVYHGLEHYHRPRMIITLTHNSTLRGFGGLYEGDNCLNNTIEEVANGSLRGFRGSIAFSYEAIRFMAEIGLRIAIAHLGEI
jgi:hypothetical protein